MNLQEAAALADILTLVFAVLGVLVGGAWWFAIRGRRKSQMLDQLKKLSKQYKTLQEIGKCIVRY